MHKIIDHLMSFVHAPVKSALRSDQWQETSCSIPVFIRDDLVLPKFRVGDKVAIKSNVGYDSDRKIDGKPISFIVFEIGLDKTGEWFYKLRGADTPRPIVTCFYERALELSHESR